MHLMTFTLFQEMDLLVLDPAVLITTGRYRADVFSIPAHRDNDACAITPINNLFGEDMQVGNR